MKTISQHRKSFEDLYAELFRGEDNELRFPLEDIEKLNWGRGRYASPFYNYMYRRFSSHTLSRLSLTGTESLLVLGCGAGNDEKNVKTLFPGVNLWSVDISRAMLQHAIASRSPSVFALAAAEALPFPERCFDRVLSREVIEHVFDPQLMMQEIGRVLKPGGIAVVTTENEDSFAMWNRPYGRLRDFVYRAVGLPPVDMKGSFKDEAPTLAEVTRWADSAGLELVSVVWDGAMYKTLPRLQRFVRDRNLARLAHRFSAIENLEKLAFYFCDQVKFVLAKPDRGAAVSHNQPRFCKPGTNLPLTLEEDAYVCKESGERFEILGGIPELMLRSSDSPPAEAEEASVTSAESSSREGVFSWARRRLAGATMRAVNLVYLPVLVLTALIATMVAPTNRDRASHLLDEGDPYLRYIHL